MNQPNWTASITEQLDDIRIHVAGRAEQLGERVRESLLAHRFAIVRGLGGPNQDRDRAIAELTELGEALGQLLPQSPLGELIRDVRDYSDSDHLPDKRGHRSRGEMLPHTDPSTLLLLHCLHPARVGGETQLVNVRAIHDSIQAKRPDLLARLYEPYRSWKQAGVSGSDTEGPTAFKFTVFSQRDGIVSCIWDRAYIDKGTAGAGETLTIEQVEALDLFDAHATSEALVVRLTLAAGETLILHNRSVLHARTDYEDWPEPERRRHLLRLWIDAPEFLPVAAEHELGDVYAGNPVIASV